MVLAVDAFGRGRTTIRVAIASRRFMLQPNACLVPSSAEEPQVDQAKGHSLSAHAIARREAS